MSSREVYGSAAAPESDDDALIDAEPDASSSRRFRVEAEHAGERLDKLLATWMPEISRSRLKQWIEDGAVRVNQSTVRPRHAVLAGDVIELEPRPAPDAAAFTPEPMALSIVHEDDAIIVIDKPAGLVVHPAAGHCPAHCSMACWPMRLNWPGCRGLESCIASTPTPPG